MMPDQPHPQRLHGRNLAVPSDQQKILDKHTVAKTRGPPHLDVPPAVHESIKAWYLRKEERKRRDAHEARLQDQARISKLQKQRHEHGDRPVTPPPPTWPAFAPAPAPSPSQGTAVSWSPSPDRTKRTTVQVSTPSRPTPPAFPSSAPEEPLEVQLPQANTEPEGLPTTGQAETPFVRRNTRNTRTPPCAQPSQPATGTPASAGKRINRFKAHAFNWSESTPQYDQVSRPPTDYKLSERVPPFRSLLPPSSNNRPSLTSQAPAFGSSLPSSSNKTTNIPPPGQTVPHPGWPAPRQHSPLKDMVHAVTTPSAESEAIVASAERPLGTEFQLSLSDSQIPLAQTMSYVSPDIASQPQAQQFELFQSSIGPGVAQELSMNGMHSQSQASQTHDPTAGVRSAVLSRLRNARSNKEQQQTRSPLQQPEPSTPKLPDVVDVMESGHKLEERLVADSTQSNGAEPAGDSQEASTMSAVSAISATQQPVKLSIAFDDVSPFDTFCKVYKEYKGDLKAFVIACICLKYVWENRLLHSSLWDDFVGHFPLYQERVAKGRKRDHLPAGEWYNDRDEEAVFTKKLIDKSNLAGILSYYGSVVQKLEGRVHKSPEKQHLDHTADGIQLGEGDRKPLRAPEAHSPKQPQERMNQQPLFAGTSNATMPSQGSTLRNPKSLSPSRIVIIDSQSDHGDAPDTGSPKSPEKPPATSTKRVSEKRTLSEKPAGTPEERSSASRNDIVTSTPADDNVPAETQENDSSAITNNDVVSNSKHDSSLAPAEPIKDAQRMAQEALQMDRLNANRLATPFPDSAPSSSKPSSTPRRTSKGPITAAQRKAMLSFQKPSKGKTKSSKEGAKAQGMERRTSSLTRSDAS